MSLSPAIVALIANVAQVMAIVAALVFTGVILGALVASFRWL